MAAGIIVMRTTRASNRMPMASANAIGPICAEPLNTKLENTEIMISAAARTTRAPWANPRRTAGVGSAPCTCSSRIRDTRNTW